MNYSPLLQINLMINNRERISESSFFIKFIRSYLPPKNELMILIYFEGNDPSELFRETQRKWRE